MLTNGARWYGETPEGRLEYARLRSKQAASMPSSFPRAGNGVSQVSPDVKPYSSPKSSFGTASDHLIRQNNWLATSLCLM